MMYTYKRNLRFPLIRKNKDSTQENTALYIKAALCCGIAVLLILSGIFISDAGQSVSSSKIVYGSEGQPDDASGSDDPFTGSVIDPKFILSQEMPVIYGVDLDNTDTQSQNELVNTEIDISIASEDIRMEIIKFAQEPQEFFVGAQGPQILVYHSHTEEAYRQIVGDEYVEAGKWYTKDMSNSVVAVGEALKNALEGYGYSVIHDETDHQPPDLNSSYSRSLVTMENYASQYPSLRVFIDVHRDSGSDMTDFVTINGDECAKVMFVVGTGERTNPEGWAKPNYESNYKLALAITNELESIKEGFTRPIRVKSGFYNQQVSDMCLLIEVGHNANSLQQAENAAKYVALAISRVLEIGGP